MTKQNRNIVFTTIAIDKETDRIIEKLCKRYSLKKGEIVKLAFQYLDKANINPSEAPESTKAELRKINKRQDDIILSHLKANQEGHNNLLKLLSEKFTGHADAINSQAKQLSAVYKNQQKDTNKILKLINLYSELATAGLMDGKRKDSLKTEIINLINS